MDALKSRHPIIVFPILGCPDYIGRPVKLVLHKTLFHSLVFVHDRLTLRQHVIEELCGHKPLVPVQTAPLLYHLHHVLHTQGHHCLTFVQYVDPFWLQLMDIGWGNYKVDKTNVTKG